jgi:hypothetical protein
VDIQTITVATNKIAEEINAKGNELSQLEAQNTAESQKKKPDRNQDFVQNFPGQKADLEGKIAALQSQLRSTRESKESEYNRQKLQADHELGDNMARLFDFSPSQPVHMQVVEVVQMQTNPVDGTDFFDLSTADCHFQFKADTNSAFSLSGIEVLENRLADPLLVSITTNADFTNSVAAKILIWPHIETFSATCDKDGNLDIQGAGLLTILNKFNEFGKYTIQINLGYGNGLNGYACFTNFSLSANPHYIFSTLAKKISNWNKELGAITNIMALDTGGPHSASVDDIWVDVGKICQRFTGSPIPYEFGKDPGIYSGARQQVVADLKNQDKIDQANSALSDDNFENLKSFLADEPQFSTFSSARNRLKFLLPSGLNFGQKLQATITIKDMGISTNGVELAQLSIN